MPTETPTVAETLERIEVLCRKASTQLYNPCTADAILDGLPALRAAVQGAAQPAHLTAYGWSPVTVSASTTTKHAAPGVGEALEAAAKIPEQRAKKLRETCQKDNYDPSTGVWECALEARGRDCLCAAAEEEAEGIAKDIRALSVKQPDTARNDTMCKARRSGGPTAVDCEWPLCDCDLAAAKVIAALEEMGALSAAPQPAQAQQPAGGVPSGWKLVPVEPTPEMMRAAEHHHELPTSSEDHRASIYRAMLSAAPTPPAAEGWRHFSECPKDGKIWPVYRPDQGVFAAHWVGGIEDEEDWYSTEGDNLTRDTLPTLYYALPAPPSGAEG